MCVYFVYLLCIYKYTPIEYMILKYVYIYINIIYII